MTTLTFLGGTGQVTGSCYLLETAQQRILLDCGLFQGGKSIEAQNLDEFPFDPATIDAVILSHAHLDHGGRLPKLAKEGFNGPVFLTQASYPLLELLLKDSAHLLLKDTEWENKRRERAGKKLLEPLYTEADVEQLLTLRHPLSYQDSHQIFPGIQLSFHEAGHILGSAIVQLKIHSAEGVKTLVFSGDLGNPAAPLLRDPDIIRTADILLLESTYGDRDHKPLLHTLDEFKTALHEAAAADGNVIIPAFAVGRTQDLIYWLGKLYRQGDVPQQRIFIDSPMAISASKIYADNANLFNLDDPEFSAIAPHGWQAWLPNLIYSETAEESMAINRISGGVIVIAGSGMCTGGRIRHHLKYNLWRHNAHIIIAGYQAEGTLGRMIVEGQKSHLKILGTDVMLSAKVHTLGALSAHADQSQLLAWAANFQDPKPRLYLVHGERNALLSLQTCFNRAGWPANVAVAGAKISF